MIMQYLIIVVLFGTLYSLMLKLFSNKGLRHMGDVFLFNAFLSVCWIAILLVWGIVSNDLVIHPKTVLYGCIYGISLCTFLFFKMQAISSGPMSLSTLIGSCAFLIATAFGVICYKETVSICQYIGMGGILVSLLLCVNPKKSGEKLTGKWYLNCFLFFVSGGAIGISYKLFGKSEVSDDINGMMLIAASVSAVLFFVFGVLISAAGHLPMPRIPKEAWKFVAACGAAGCVYSRLGIAVSGIVPSAVFFPVCNGGMVILSALLGWLFCREKLKPIQLIGMGTGLLAIIITGCGDAILGLR